MRSPRYHYWIREKGWGCRSRALPGSVRNPKREATVESHPSKSEGWSTRPPAIMVVGQAQNTESRSSTPWLMAVMHEHFHQLQWAQPGYVDAVNQLDLSGGDT